MYLDITLKDYVEQASAGTPTPGGGSVAAFSGALGVSMACMAANFTVGREKFKDVEPQVQKLLDECIHARDELLRLTEEDSKAYSVVSAAYGLPRGTPEEKGVRRKAVQRALVTAMDAPLKTMRVCVEVLRSVAALAEVANPNLISDVGVAAILSEAALRAAKLNVEINLSGIKDEDLVARTHRELQAAADEAKAKAQLVLKKVYSKTGDGS